MRTSIPAVLAVAAVALLPPAASAAAVPVVVIDGRGWGHGVGMAQDGALAMGRTGASTEKILSHFYPGTRPGRAGGPVRVPVWESPPAKVMSAALEFPDGGEVRDAEGGSQSPGFPVVVPRGGQVKVVFEGGRYRVEGDGVPGGARKASAGPAAGAEPAGAGAEPAGAGAVRPAQQAPPQPPTSTTLLPPTPDPTAPPPTTPVGPVTPPTPTPPPGPAPGPSPPAPGAAPVSTRPLWAVPAGGGTVGVPARARRYRGVMEVAAPGGPLRLVNKVDVEQYLRGMGEVRDSSWPPAALRAQAIAARTYALRAMAAAGEICETQRCQVYLGAQAEYGAMDRAVQATSSQVLLFGGRLASAVYSANGGGVSASPEEGFGLPATGYPYLRAAPYTTHDPFPWTVKVALADVRRRFGYRGTLTGVRIGRAGPSGRALDVVLEGSSGDVVVPGVVFDAGLGLRSTLFTLRQEEAAVAPPPPPPGEVIQAPPDLAGEQAEDVALAAGVAGGGDDHALRDTAAPLPETARAGPIAAHRPMLGVLAGLAAMLLAGVAGETRDAARRRTARSHGAPPVSAGAPPEADGSGG